ncbi:putative RNA-directed DNA polymerase from transposon X-element [Aspergillus affinis]|uniref:putative RNA-directed DNA polymerase from transposon X-element n=1 Tax=Aspergillus affinis TaxID=1070780 RepID=UPI0022FE4399|nr:putative RNA-directed DNA polymerase from transposon X-element [Aspergillus affinis]KAI9041807.1 putative RNA-directed DNA polymerase from transposon X-element [Aspergillus affinis]
MVGAKTPWPALSGVPEAANSSNQNFLTCVLNLHAHAKSFISHNEQARKQLPKPVIDFFEQVVTYCSFMQRQTTDILDRNAHLGPELASIKQILQNVQQHTYSTQSSIRNQSYQSWASVVRNASPPAHTLSTYDSSSTAPATPSELSKDREVIVKLRDTGAQKTYRKKLSAEIKDKAESIKKRGAATILTLSLARARFVSARQLRSGDLSLALRTAAEAETARIYDKWADLMSSEATLRRPTWGVVVHSIPIKSIQDLNDQGEQDRVASELLDENREIWNQKPDIKRVAWLTYPSNYKNQKSSALVVEFSDPRHANEVIMKGTIWASDSRMTVLYDRNARIRRYFKCQQYRHIGIVCSNKTTCGLCAEGHETQSCVQRSAPSSQGRKCAGCGETHAAWPRICTRYVAEQERVQTAAQYRQPLYRIPPYLRDYPSVGSDTETSGPPNSEGRAAGSGRQRERWTQSISRPAERNHSTVRFQKGSILLYSSQELVLVQQEEALIDLSPEIDVDPTPSETEPSIAQQINIISEPETPAPVTPAPRGCTLSKRRPRSITLRATRRSARHQVTQEAAPFAISPATGDILLAKRTRSKQPTYRERSISTSDITSDNAVIALLKSPEASLIPAPTPSGHSTTIVLAEDNTLARSVGTGTLGLVNDLTTNNTNDYVLLLGDFNLHHPAWGGENAARDTLSNQLLDLSDRRCLDLWLKPGTTTRDEAGAKTTIDLVLGSQDLTPRLVACKVTKKIHADSNHLPIRTLIDIQTKIPEAQRRRNWKACKVKDLQTFVDLNLYSKAFPLENKQHIELAIEFFIETARNRDASGGLVPTLKIPDNGLAETAEQKVKTFQKAFFPHLPPADLSDIPTTSLPRQLGFPDLAEHEVLRCIRKAPPDKAPGPDGIPNKVWHWLGEVPSFVKALTSVFNACIRLGHNPGYFQQSITVVFRKAAPRDYRVTKSYRPIALLNTLGKILEAAIATRIAYALEEHSLLLRGHLGGRKGISVDHLIQLLIDAIFDDWGRGQKIDDACTIALSGSYAANQRLLEWALDKAANGSAREGPVEPPGHDQLPIKDHATGHVIRPVEHAKYLGIWLDKTLSFTTHCTKAVAKANGSLEALRNISASTWGTSLLNMRTIYLAVVVPQMLYGVAAWYSPTSGRSKYAKRQKTINEFERIQTRAAILISGAFRNTVSAALGAELFLLSVCLHIQQIIEETTIRIQTGPAMACPQGLVKKRSSAEIKCFNGHVGGAAVSIRAGKVRKKYLGAAADPTVQAAIQAVQNPGRPSGQYVLRAIYERIRTLRGSSMQQEDIELRWIPAHIGIEGNERADEAAKRAAIKGIELSSVGPRELAAQPITRLAAAAKTDVCSIEYSRFMPYSHSSFRGCYDKQDEGHTFRYPKGSDRNQKYLSLRPGLWEQTPSMSVVDKAIVTGESFNRLNLDDDAESVPELSPSSSAPGTPDDDFSNPPTPTPIERSRNGKPILGQRLIIPAASSAAPPSVSPDDFLTPVESMPTPKGRVLFPREPPGAYPDSPAEVMPNETKVDKNELADILGDIKLF